MMVYYRRIDGVRVVAVAAVMATHFLWSQRALIVLGNYGVQLFFVISGFLITGILNEQNGDFKKAFKTFIVRRVLRIFPLYYFSLVFAISVGWIDLFPFDIWHWLYGSNWLYWLQGSWLRGHPAHFWSLSVEEQFYLFWPLVFLAMARDVRKWAPVGLFFIGLSFRLYANNSWIGETGLWHIITPACFQALGAGALLSQFIGRGSTKWISRTLILILFMLTALHSFSAEYEYEELKYQVYMLLCLFLIWTVCRAKRTWFDWFLLNPFVRWLGMISYGIYVWHNFMQHPWETIGPWTIYACDLAGLPGWFSYSLVPLIGKSLLTLIFSTVSWYLVEKPLLKLKRFFPYG